MKHLKLTNGEVTQVDDNTYGLLSQYSWTQDGSAKGYVLCTSEINERRIHRLIIGAKPGEYVDHIDGNPLNNQYSNLRICSRRQNHYNRKVNKNSDSKFKGVTYNKGIEMYTAQIRFNGKLKYLGCYMDKVKAAEAYNEAATKYFGEYARLNQI